MLIHRDRHLNVFWNYSENAHLENNLTKAIINTLESLSNMDRLSITGRMINSPELEKAANDYADKYRFEFYLQTKPHNFPNCVSEAKNRFQLAINPSGKPWGGNILSINYQQADNLIISEIEEMIREGEPSENQDVIHQRALDEHQIIQKRGDSIPDAWILIFHDSKPISPEYCIIVENKLYDLNPYQLINHQRKSLLLDSKTKPVYQTFANVYSTFLKYKKSSVFVPHLLEYFSLLGYEPICDFVDEDFFSLVVDANDKRFYENLLQKKMFRFLNDEITHSFDSEKYHYDVNSHRLSLKDIDRFNLFFDFDIESGVLSISSEIGVSRKYINMKILPALLADSTLAGKISNYYSSEYFVRYLRLNHFSASLYFWIKEYSDLSFYLNTIDKDKIYIDSLNKEECIQMLLDLGVNSKDQNIVRVSKYKFETWNKLEYMRIIRDFDIKEYLNDNEKLRKALKLIIDKHLDGIGLLESIYQS